MRSAATVIGAAALLALSGCDDVAPEALTSCEDSFALPSVANVDILFVIDDSGSMSEEQANVRDNLGAFIGALELSPVRLDYQLGVTNTAVAGFGSETAYAAGTQKDGVPFPAGRLIAVDGAGNYSYTDPKRIVRSGSPTRVADFQENVIVGIEGTGKEQMFRAARLALEEHVAPTGANAGFLRSGARLAIVFVTDEDDCSDVSGDVVNPAGCIGTSKASLDPIPELVSFLRGPIAGEQRDVVVAAIGGLDMATLAPSCGSSSWCDPDSPSRCDSAYDRGDRLVELLDALGAAATLRDSICKPDFGDSLLAIADLIIPTEMPLEGAPADWRLLVVGVAKASTGQTVACEVAPDGPSIPPTADAIYVAPQGGRPAKLRFQGDCLLEQGDRVDLDVVCAG